MSLSLMHPVVLICVLLCAPTAHGLQNLSPSARSNLNNILEDFLSAFPDECLPFTQFAVMTFDATRLYDLQRLDRFFSYTEGGEGSSYYVAARPRSGTHSEDFLINAFNNRLGGNVSPPSDVYIFTHYTPCERCAQRLQLLAINNPNTNFHIGFRELYRDFPRPLEYLQEPNMHFGDICEPPNDGLKRTRRTTCVVITCNAYCDSWMPWVDCSEKCGGGMQYRFRNCVGGYFCCDPDFQERRCNTQSCRSCFASESMVRVKLLTKDNTQIQRKRIDELKVGDHVESYDRETNSVAFSEVYFISHDGDTGNSTRLLKLIVGSDHGKELSLRLHSKHLVYSCQMKPIDKATRGYKAEPCRHPPVNPVTAESVKVGDTLWVRNSAGEFSPRPVIEIGEAWSGVRHPMTLNHYIVVDDVLASVHMYDEGLYRQITAPIRFAYGISPSITDTWLVKKLVQMWDSVEDRYL